MGRRLRPTLGRMDTLIGTALEVLLAGTGRVAVWLFSVGRWKSEPFGSNENRIYAAAGALSFVHEGRRFITHPGQIFAGLAFYAVVIVLAVLYAVAV
jgi:hypothetical protein